MYKCKCIMVYLNIYIFSSVIYTSFKNNTVPMNDAFHFLS